MFTAYECIAFWTEQNTIDFSISYFKLEAQQSWAYGVVTWSYAINLNLIISAKFDPIGIKLFITFLRH